LAERAAEVLPLGGIQAFQGSLIAPLPFFPSPTNPTHKNSNKPFQSWQFPKALALSNSTYLSFVPNGTEKNMIHFLYKAHVPTALKIISNLHF
jgi:hypothetical protein